MLMSLWSLCLSEAHSLVDSLGKVMGKISSDVLHADNSLSLFLYLKFSFVGYLLKFSFAFFP